MQAKLFASYPDAYRSAFICVVGVVGTRVVGSVSGRGFMVARFEDGSVCGYLTCGHVYYAGEDVGDRVERVGRLLGGLSAEVRSSQIAGLLSGGEVKTAGELVNIGGTMWDTAGGFAGMA